jgi:5-oxoprolinase (ATP-hydrolysing)
VTGVGRGEKTAPVSWSTELKRLHASPLVPPTPLKTTRIYFEELGEYAASTLYELCELPVGTVIHGPAIILDDTQTIVVFPANETTILKDHVYIDVGLGPKNALDTSVVDPIALSIFGNR